MYIASCLVFITQSVCAPSVFSGQNLKCKIKIEDYAKDVEVEDGDNDEDENYTTLHYTVVEDGDNDEDENYTGEILSL